MWAKPVLGVIVAICVVAIGLVVRSSISGRAAAPDPGVQAIYRGLCASCHGEQGDGKGPAAAALMPPPVDLTNARYMKRLTDTYLGDVIRNGKLAILRRVSRSGLSNASMPGFGAVLSKAEISRLVDQVTDASSRGGWLRGILGGGMMMGGMMGSYQRYCASCHGMGGRGDGASGSSMQPPPADFSDRRFMSRFSRRYLVNLITYGKVATIEKPGSATMPPMGTDLDDTTLKRLVAYLRWLAR